MYKKFLKLFLVGALTVGLTGMFTSCKDYDDDIDNLQSQIDSQATTIASLQSLINSGAVITNVTNTSTGVTVTLSDGTSFSLTNGADGADGEDADVWTIGSDGYWYLNGSKTDYKAIGTDGAQGATGEKGDKGDKGDTGDTGAAGKDGEDGQDGEDGSSYVLIPNAATGYFDLYEVTENTDGTYSYTLAQSNYFSIADANTLTAVWDGTTLTLYNVYNSTTGEYETVEIDLGTALTSLAFVPNVIQGYLGYPTTDDPFTLITTYYDEKVTDANGRLTPMDTLDASSTVEMVYRINPSDAYLEATYVDFITRGVEVRSVEGDVEDVLDVVSSVRSGSTLTVGAKLNTAAAVAVYQDADADVLLGALRATVGTESVVVSDYVYINAESIRVSLVDSIATLKTTPALPVALPARSYAIASETAKTIAEDLSYAREVNALKFAYDSSIDIADYVGLWAETYGTDAEFASDLGYEVSYTYALPEEYLGSDDATNQQKYVVLNGSIVSVNTDWIAAATAENRTPVVRVDAYITDNHGVKQLVATAYVLLDIVAPSEDVSTTTPDKDPNKVDLTMNATVATDTLEYHADLSATALEIAGLSWDEVTEQMYSLVELNSQNFWDVYDAEKITAKVTDATSTLNKTTEYVKVDTDTEVADGIYVTVNDNAATTESSAVSLSVDNQVLTQHTYGGSYATYTVTITIPLASGTDATEYGPFELTYTFSVYEECAEALVLDDNYLVPDTYEYNGTVVDDAIVVLFDGDYETYIASHFDADTYPVSTYSNGIFDYVTTTMKNVKNVTFDVADDYSTLNDETGAVADTTSSASAYLTPGADGIDGDYTVSKVNYYYTLANGELCNDSGSYTYYVVFVNPFLQVGTFYIALNLNNEGTVPATYEGDQYKYSDFAYAKYVLSDRKNQTSPVLTYTVVSLEDASKNITIEENGANYGLDDASTTITVSFEENEDAEDYAKCHIARQTELVVDEETGKATIINLGGAVYNINDDANSYYTGGLVATTTIVLNGVTITTYCDVEVYITDDEYDPITGDLIDHSNDYKLSANTEETDSEDDSNA